ncbi:histidine kinase dimerization/phosphoacceptor domain -containing protein [Dyadobacter pollutisoli]|uniref:histidine kinase n=1 Tax=Dyadobacter pollutisoli TaxID=2910158 RepID=A0A9E8NAE6_9BACT|nr:histidine kinase dimerization/phosphoacceptor domain -containing protein [Dyadobacter pollutisoli]WAC12979.1 tetratricopeptide repeat protein [Dyadobacter pollutisoli]
MKPEYLKIVALSLWLFAVPWAVCQAQDAKRNSYQDSLQAMIDAPSTDPEIKEALFLLGEHLVQRDPDYADSIGTRLKSDFIDIRDSAEVRRVDYMLAAANRWQGDYATAISIYKKIYEYSKSRKDSVDIAQSGQFIGTLSMFIGQNVSAQQHLIEAASIYARIGTPAQKASVQSSLASFYMSLDQKKKAEERYLAALQQFTTMKDSAGMASVNANLGMLYTDLGDFKKAEDHLFRQKALNAIFPTLREMGFHYDFLGKLRQKQGRLGEAYQSLIQALRIREKLSSTYNLCESKLNIGEILILLKRYPEAIVHLNQVFDYQEHKSLNQQQQAYQLLSEAYEKTNNSEAALASFKAFKQISDSIYSEKSIRIIAEKDAEYNMNRQRDEIKLLNKEKEVSQSQLFRSRIIIYITIFGLVLIMVAAILVLLLYKKIKYKNELISRTLRDKELLMHEIHHRVKNNLQLISSLLNLQSKYVYDEIAFEALQKGRHRVKSMAILHQQLYTGKEITDVNMEDYLRELANNIVGQYAKAEKSPTLDISVHEVLMNVDQAISVGLIVNELLTNALKHAFPTERSESGLIEVIMSNAEKGGWMLTVRDNGIGGRSEIPAGEQKGNDAFGRRLVSLLAQKLGAMVQTKDDNGTEITIRIPQLAANEASQ